MKRLLPMALLISACAPLTEGLDWDQPFVTVLSNKPGVRGVSRTDIWDYGSSAAHPGVPAGHFDGSSWAPTSIGPPFAFPIAAPAGNGALWMAANSGTTAATDSIFLARVSPTGEILEDRSADLNIPPQMHPSLGGLLSRNGTVYFSYTLSPQGASPQSYLYHLVAGRFVGALLPMPLALLEVFADDDVYLVEKKTDGTSRVLHFDGNMTLTDTGLPILPVGATHFSPSFLVQTSRNDVWAATVTVTPISDKQNEISFSLYHSDGTQFTASTLPPSFVPTNTLSVIAVEAPAPGVMALLYTTSSAFLGDAGDATEKIYSRHWNGVTLGDPVEILSLGGHCDYFNSLPCFADGFAVFDDGTYAIPVAGSNKSTRSKLYLGRVSEL